MEPCAPCLASPLRPPTQSRRRDPYQLPPHLRKRASSKACCRYHTASTRHCGIRSRWCFFVDADMGYGRGCKNIQLRSTLRCAICCDFFGLCVDSLGGLLALDIGAIVEATERKEAEARGRRYGGEEALAAPAAPNPAPLLELDGQGRCLRDDFGDLIVLSESDRSA